MSQDWSGKRVFITGATGLLGSHLTRFLVEKGAEIFALVRDNVPGSLFYSEDIGWGLSQKVTAIRGEIEDFFLIERILNEYEIDTVFHLAAQTIVGCANRSPLATFKANIEGTWNVLEAARVHQRKVRRVIVASSDKAYGNLKGDAYDEGFPLMGEHPYDVSKSCADLIAQSYFKTYELPVAITRCGNFFGPGDLNFNRIIPETIRSVLRGEAPVIRSDGKSIRDYIYVADGAYAYLALAEAMVGDVKAAEGKSGETKARKGNKGAFEVGLGSQTFFAGEAFNFSYGLKLSALDVVTRVVKAMGRDDLKPTILGQVKNEIPIQSLDSAKAKELLKWSPRFGFDEGLQLTIQWYSQFFERQKKAHP